MTIENNACINTELFEQKLREMINSFGFDNAYSTPDHLLARVMMESLRNFGRTVVLRDKLSSPYMFDKPLRDVTI